MIHLRRRPFRIKEIVPKGSPREALADPLFQALPEDDFGETKTTAFVTPDSSSRPA